VGFAWAVAFLTAFARFLPALRQQVLAVPLFLPKPCELAVAGDAYLRAGERPALGRGRFGRCGEERPGICGS